MLKLSPKERIYLIKRRHRIVLYLRLIPVLLIFIILVILIFYLIFQSPIPWPSFFFKFWPQFSMLNLKFLLLFVLSQILSLVWIMIFIVFVSYYFDYWIVTNQRVIHAELKGLFNMQISNILYEKIQDITISIKGVLASIFHFGDITVQSAGEYGQFTFSQIPDPEIVKQVIVENQIDWLKQKYDKGSI